MNHIVKRGLPLMFADLLIVNIAFILAAFVNNLVDY